MHMNKKIVWFLIFVVVISAAGAYGLSRVGSPESSGEVLPKETGAVNVVATFYPLAAFARGVAGDRATVSSIVPIGMEPHEYEPTPQDILAIRKADLFLVNGAGMDEWAKKLRPELEARGVKILVMEDVVTLRLHEGEAAGSSVPDPHFWLDPMLAAKETAAILGALVAIDPSNAGTYDRNGSRLNEKFFALDRSFRQALVSCAKHDIITSHDAFGYLAARYGFVSHAIAGISPEEEPSPRRIAEFSNLAKTLGTRYIFTESLVSPKIAETLAREAGAETLVFNPIEGLTPEEEAAGEDYFSIMDRNIANLSKAMECVI